MDRVACFRSTARPAPCVSSDAASARAVDKRPADAGLSTIVDILSMSVLQTRDTLLSTGVLQEPPSLFASVAASHPRRVPCPASRLTRARRRHRAGATRPPVSRACERRLACRCRGGARTGEGGAARCATSTCVLQEPPSLLAYVAASHPRRVPCPASRLTRASP